MPVTSPQLHYRVSIASIAGHLFHINLSVEKPDTQGQILSLPAWIPGSYMIRDFAKNIVSLSAKSDCGSPVEVKKLDKQTWKAQPVSGPLHIEYQVYANDLSVRGAYLNDELAFFNGTNMFLSVHGQTDQECTIELIKPNDKSYHHWRVATTMSGNDKSPHQFGIYKASHYNDLIDHPVLMGEFDLLPFNAKGVNFELILAGGHQADTKRITDDLAKICQHHLEFFTSPYPVKYYQFITLLTDDAFGGLEHISSTALMFSRNDLPYKHQKSSMTEGYQVFLSLCSHEFFHTWHVKRIKPEELVSNTLSTEQYTEQLWIYEGFTSYYDDLALLRCGIIQPQEYLKIVSQNLTRLERNKGRFKQSVTESSFDAWTKFYKQDESAVNNIVSYYNKGAVVALCLDLLLRLDSGGRYSLDDVMMHLWRNFGQTKIPTPKHVIHQIISDNLKLDLSDFLNLALYSTEELPTADLLKRVGIELKFSSRETFKDKGGEQPKSPLNIEFGAQFKGKETGVLISQVTEGTAAYESGMQVGDLLMAIDIWQVSEERLKNQLNNMVEGQSVTLTVFRDKKLKKLEFVAKAAPSDTIYLSIEDKLLCKQWLNLPN